MNDEVRKQDLDKNEVSLIAFILAFFLPPLGVAIKDGIRFSFCVNLILTLLGWIPGILHALYVILRK